MGFLTSSIPSGASILLSELWRSVVEISCDRDKSVSQPTSPTPGICTGLYFLGCIVTELWPKYMKRSDLCQLLGSHDWLLFLCFLSLFPHLPAGVKIVQWPISVGRSCKSAREKHLACWHGDSGVGLFCYSSQHCPKTANEVQAVDPWPWNSQVLPSLWSSRLYRTGED